MKAHVLIAVLGSFLLAPATVRAQDTVVYYHTDAIGSVRAITDSTGAEIARYDYLPFGELWPASPPAPADVRQFAGKERDSHTELDYFGARYYASRTGRFTTVDPLMNIDAALTDPQRWNRYAYSLNNPLRFIDPDGAEITTPAAFFTKAFQQQTADNLRAVGKVVVNIGRSINSPGHMTPEAEARYFEQPDSAAEGSRMQFFDLVLTAAPALAVAGRTATTIDTTAHGTVRIAGQGATRGGTLSATEITSVRGAYDASYTSNVNGATALVARTANGRYNVVVQGSNGKYITSFRTIDRKTLNRMAEKYEWEKYEPQ